MGMFAYKGHDASALVMDAYTIATSTTLAGYDIAKPLPAGWSRLSADELGISASNVDARGAFKGESELGTREDAAQSYVLGKYDAGGILTEIAFSIAGTNSQADKAEWHKLVDASYIRNFDYVLDAVETYATARGLDGSDVLVTGYSLGGGAANNMYEVRETAWNGFYADADFVAFAGLQSADADDGIFNFGYENDVIFRVDLDSPLVDWNRLATDETYVPPVPGNDGSFASSTDNVLLFDTIRAYGWDQNHVGAAADFPYVKAYGFQLDNIFGWSAHLSGIMQNQVERIATSSFYDLMDEDSHVVLTQYQTDALKSGEWPGWDFSGMNPPPNVWIKGGDVAVSTFLVGAGTVDWLEDGKRDDHVDALAGDDLVRLSGGHDVVAGGAGTDTVFLLGGWSDYKAFRLADGTLVLNDKTLALGAKELVGVEKIAVEGPLHAANDATLAVSTSLLTFSAHTEGTTSADSMVGTVGTDALFGLAGNDTLAGGTGDDTLHGGSGDDRLDAGTGRNVVLGGDGVDTAVFQGVMSQYGFGQNGSTITVTNGGVSDHLNGVEFFEFADRTIAVADFWMV
ncbi:calcium-binding protein [Aureimonas jatrophae]|uniref:Triacylglycerol lipase n=1 Tax=Aureimonas jatrophae TaxID=1166073 RepID=A0A1H0KC76_9HYPH|nr:calcium-binding protein [Aureimonas jatrophae]MBB3951057.1 Ca2+-binding RTX toxin-like protein [Aureimonas jatrophae]SDO53524.1 hypothetical protein SAMN05192530_107204 [Aureimonas jatrophae]